MGQSGNHTCAFGQGEATETHVKSAQSNEGQPSRRKKKTGCNLSGGGSVAEGERDVRETSDGPRNETFWFGHRNEI